MLFAVSAIDVETPLIPYEQDGTVTTDPEMLAFPSPLVARAGLTEITEAPIPNRDKAMRSELNFLLKLLNNDIFFSHLVATIWRN